MLNGIAHWTSSLPVRAAWSKPALKSARVAEAAVSPQLDSILAVGLASEGGRRTTGVHRTWR
jgi:hypothetical protein